MNENTDYTFIKSDDNGNELWAGSDFDEYGYEMVEDECKSMDRYRDTGRFWIDRTTGKLHDSERQVKGTDEYDEPEVRDEAQAEIYCHRGYGNENRYLSDFNEIWDLNDNSKAARAYFRELMDAGSFKNFDIYPQRSKYRKTGYWLNVYAMCLMAQRLEKFYRQDWWYNRVFLEVRDSEGEVLSTSDSHTVESDAQDYDPLAEYEDGDKMLKDAKIEQDAAAYRALLAAGQFEFSLDTEAVII